jgi:hypothetical protein
MYLAEITAGSKSKEILENRIRPILKVNNFMGIECDLWVCDELPLTSQHAIGFNLMFNKKSTDLILEQYQDDVDQTVNLARETRARTPTHEFKARTKKLIVCAQQSQIDSVYDEKYKFHVQVKGYERCKLSVKTDGSFLVKLTPLPTSVEASAYQYKDYTIMYRVKTTYGKLNFFLLIIFARKWQSLSERVEIKMHREIVCCFFLRRSYFT